MIITLLSQEKNTGLITLTQYLKENYNNLKEINLSYLYNNNEQLIEEAIKQQTSYNLLFKYVTPKKHFGNQGFRYPDKLDDISDVIFMVPSYIEEIQTKTPQIYLKGKDNIAITKVINKFYV